MMRVLVTDDSAFMRRAVSSMLSADPEIEVVGLAQNGREAVDLAKSLKPDVITLDIEMPEMDGLTALRHIMRSAPTQVLMLSSLTTEGSTASLQALKLGAADVLAKDQSNFSMNMSHIQEDLIRLVKALAKSNPHNKPAAVKPASQRIELPRYRSTQFDLVCIGSSTGGPPVLETILGELPATIKPPIVVAQHMPEIFTRSMSERLNKLCHLNVKHIEKSEPLQSGTIYVARGGMHVHIKKTAAGKLEARMDNEPTSAIYKPSVNNLFETAADASGSRTLAIVLTGIGTDGLDGGKKLHEAGGELLAQDENSCVVYGMPKAVAQAGIIKAALSPTDIGKSLNGLSQASIAA